MSVPKRNLLLYWLPIAVYVGLIVVLSSLSRLPFRIPEIPYLDKLIHFLEYGLLAVLVARAIRSLPWPGTLWRVLLVTVAIVSVLGGLDELYQSTVPHRDSDVLDLLADAAGGLTGSLIYLGLVGLLAKRRSVEV